MIQYRQGNMLQTDAEALVNTVNCVGVMGKGIALQFKKAFPNNFKAYEKACRNKEVVMGKMFTYLTGSMMNPKYIINFPTKFHWKEKSRYEHIEAGLQSLVEDIKRFGISSVAVPPLGCGLGGLDWNRVKSMVERAFSSLPNVTVFLYEPKGSPAAQNMLIGTARPRMTVARSLFIKLMQQYIRFGYSLTLLEIQKLAYFLQESGQALRLNYVRHIDGPYAHNLNKVLEVLEGHYIKGYGDKQQPDVRIELMPNAVEEADVFLQNCSDEMSRLDKVSRLVDGFETPYGMELLASVHWLAAYEQAESSDDAVKSIHLWSERKKRLFKPEHIRVAWQRLADERWIPRRETREGSVNRR